MCRWFDTHTSLEAWCPHFGSILFFVFLICFSASSQARADKAKAANYATVELKGVTFHIPKNLLAPAVAVDEFGFLIFLPLPDVTPATLGPDGKIIDKRKPVDRTIRINLDAKRPGPRALSMHYTIKKSIGAPYAVPESGPFGLTIERAIPRSGQPIGWVSNDLYTSGSPDSPATYVNMNCSSDLVTDGPAIAHSAKMIAGACSMGFLYKDFFVKVGFPKYRLSEWMVIKTYAMARLDSFVVKGNSSDEGHAAVAK